MEKHLLLDRLSEHKPRINTENTNYAAVAIVLLLDEVNHELFLIRRTTHPNDPWSGQIGLPGGRHEDEDKNLIQTAIRETHEETNIILTDAQFISQIDDQQGYATGGKINLTVRPFVFLIDKKPQITINYELDHYYWLPINHFKDNNNHIYFNPMPNFADRPGVQIDEGNILWGMTYRIMTDFFKAVEIETPFIGDYDRSR